MTQKKSQSLLRIYLSSLDKEEDNKPLYESIVESAHAEGVAGATVLKSVFGYSPNEKEIAGKLAEKKKSSPIVIEIVDNYEIIIAFFEKIKSKFDNTNTNRGCLITIEHLDVLFYK